MIDLLNEAWPRDYVPKLLAVICDNSFLERWETLSTITSRVESSGIASRRNTTTAPSAETWFSVKQKKTKFRSDRASGLVRCDRHDNEVSNQTNRLHLCFDLSLLYSIIRRTWLLILIGPPLGDLAPQNLQPPSPSDWCRAWFAREGVGVRPCACLFVHARICLSASLKCRATCIFVLSKCKSKEPNFKESIRPWWRELLLSTVYHYQLLFIITNYYLSLLFTIYHHCLSLW